LGRRTGQIPYFSFFSCYAPCSFFYLVQALVVVSVAAHRPLNRFSCRARFVFFFLGCVVVFFFRLPGPLFLPLLLRCVFCSYPEGPGAEVSLQHPSPQRDRQVPLHSMASLSNSVFSTSDLLFAPRRGDRQGVSPRDAVPFCLIPNESPSLPISQRPEPDFWRAGLPLFERYSFFFFLGLFKENSTFGGRIVFFPIGAHFFFSLHCISFFGACRACDFNRIFFSFSQEHDGRLFLSPKGPPLA